MSLHEHSPAALSLVPHVDQLESAEDANVSRLEQVQRPNNLNLGKYAVRAFPDAAGTAPQEEDRLGKILEQMRADDVVESEVLPSSAHALMFAMFQRDKTPLARPEPQVAEPEQTVALRNGEPLMVFWARGGQLSQKMDALYESLRSSDAVVAGEAAVTPHG